MMGNMETQGNRFNQPIPLGTNVFDVNGEKVGSVSGYNAEGEYLTIQKGWLLTHDIYVPSRTIGRVIASEVHLNLSKDDLKAQSWATPPPRGQASRAASMGSTGAAPAPEQGRLEPESGRMELEQGRLEPESAQAELEQGRLEPESGRMELEQGRLEPESGRMAGTRATSAHDDYIRLPIREEEFVAEKQAAETKHIHLHKHVVEERATSSMPVTREEVTIERFPAEEGSLAADENAFREQDIEIPLSREEVVGGKRVVAHEEVRIHKQQLTEMKEVSGTVRKERWSVEGAEGQDQAILPHEPDEQSALGSSETVQ